ncbi:MAG: class I SAM-dependent methyltransferase [Aureispira sp.]|nr:class I SAM-dependent methyltransferase [Aureispira sp.]
MLSHKQYELAFAELCSRTSEYQDLNNWLLKNVELLNLGDIEVALSLGGGTGIFDNAFKEFLPSLSRYAVVEPNPAHVEEFKKLIKFDERFEFHQKDFEECVVESQFDLVILSHCLYYMNPQFVYETLQKHTKAWLIFHQSEHGINRIQQRYGDEQTKTKMYCSKNIEDDLAQAKIPYKKHRVDSFIDVSNPNRHFVNFLLEKEVTDQEFETVSSFLSKEYSDGRMYHPVDVLKIDMQ